MAGLLALGLALALGLIFLRRRRWLRLAGLGLLGFYLLVVAGLVLFPIALPEDWPANLTWEDTLRSLKRVNLIPFYYGSMLSGGLRFRVVFREIGGNILLTVPLGVGICALARLRGKGLLLFALGVGLAFEGAQLFLKLVLGAYMRTVDINDVLLNALGVMIGGGLYWLGDWIVRSVRGMFRKAAG